MNLVTIILMTLPAIGDYLGQQSQPDARPSARGKAPVTLGKPVALKRPYWVASRRDRYQYLWSPDTHDWLGCWDPHSRTYRAWLADRKTWSEPQEPPHPVPVTRPPAGKLLVFSAQWCGPCQAMKPIEDELELEGYPIERHDIDQDRGLADRYGIASVPCFVLVRGDRPLGRITGRTSKQQLIQMFQDSVAEQAGIPARPAEELARRDDLDPVQLDRQ